MNEISRWIMLKVAVVFVATVIGLVGLVAENPFIQKVSSFSSGPPPAHTGAPDESSCLECHELDGGGGQFTITAPATYTPGQTYQIQVRHVSSDPNRKRWGFQLTALAGSAGAGSFSNLAATTQITDQVTRSYIMHTSLGTFLNQTGGALWTFNWTAPATNVGTVKMYAAGNQANGNNQPTGDEIYLADATISPGAAPTAPSTLTASATGLTTTSATLNGSGNPNNATSTGWFRYSTTNPGTCSDSFGTRAPLNSANDAALGSGSSAVAYSQAVSGLAPGTTYYFCAIAQNVAGTTFGSVLSFTTQSATSVAFDFDGDRKSDLSIFRPSNGQWWLSRSTAGLIVHNFGNSSDTMVPGDFTGDGKADVAIFRPSAGEWFILRSEDSSYFSYPFGASEDTPVPGDYDGDGKTDAAVFRSSNATWYISRSSGGTTIQTFGASTDRPVAADYDGDGKTDLAIYRPSNGQWWLNRSTAGLIVHTFGTSSDRQVAADFTGDGKADVAFWRPSTGEWFILRSEDASYFSFPFGANGDVPVPGDYDGDGKADSGVFRPSSATWYVNRSTAGLLIQNFGAATDLPVPNAFVR